MANALRCASCSDVLPGEPDLTCEIPAVVLFYIQTAHPMGVPSEEPVAKEAVAVVESTQHEHKMCYFTAPEGLRVESIPFLIQKPMQVFEAYEAVDSDSQTVFMGIRDFVQQGAVSR